MTETRGASRQPRPRSRLFAALGAVMTDRATAGGRSVAVGRRGRRTRRFLAWRGVDRVAARRPASPWSPQALVLLGHAQSSNLGWMGLCVIVGLGRADLGARDRRRGGPPSWACCSDSSGRWTPPSRAGRPGSSGSVVHPGRLRSSPVGSGITVEQLEAAQHQLAERSRAEERTRIAGEVHDVIGHALTVSLLHIGSARLALDEDPQEARRSLGGGRAADPRRASRRSAPPWA